MMDFFKGINAVGGELNKRCVIDDKILRVI
jgi:hypothetical protein